MVPGLLAGYLALVLGQPGKPVVGRAVQVAIISEALKLTINDPVLTRGRLPGVDVLSDPEASVRSFARGVRTSPSDSKAALPALPRGLKRAGWDDVFACRVPGENATCRLKRRGNYLGVFGVSNATENELTVHVVLVTNDGERAENGGVGSRLIFGRDTTGKWVFLRKGPYVAP